MKYLELTLQDDESTLQLPISNIGTNRYLLSNKSDHSVLMDGLFEWLNQNESVSDDTYSKFIELRNTGQNCPKEIIDQCDPSEKDSGLYSRLKQLADIMKIDQNSMQNIRNFDKANDFQSISQEKSEKKHPAEKVEINIQYATNQIIEKMDQQVDLPEMDYLGGNMAARPLKTSSDQQHKYIYTSDELGNLKKWSLQGRSLFYDYGICHNGSINSIIVTYDGKKLFSCDSKGCLKCWDTKTHTLIYDFGKISEKPINCLIITHKDNYLFTGDGAGRQLQFDISENVKLVEDYGIVHEDQIWGMEITANDKFLYTSNAGGTLIKWSISKRKLLKDFGKIHAKSIFTILTTYDQKYLFTSGKRGSLKQYSLQTDNLVKDYGKIHSSPIFAISATYDSQFLFTADCTAKLKMWSIPERKLLHNFGQIHRSSIFAMKVTPDNEFQFTSDSLGFLMQWSIHEKKLVVDWGKIHTGAIYSICLSKEDKKELEAPKNQPTIDCLKFSHDNEAHEVKNLTQTPKVSPLKFENLVSEAIDIDTIHLSQSKQPESDRTSLYFVEDPIQFDIKESTSNNQISVRGNLNKTDRPSLFLKNDLEVSHDFIKDLISKENHESDLENNCLDQIDNLTASYSQESPLIEFRFGNKKNKRELALDYLEDQSPENLKNVKKSKFYDRDLINLKKLHEETPIEQVDRLTSCLFTTNNMHPNLRKWLVSTLQLYKDFTMIDTEAVHTIMSTPNGKYVFIMGELYTFQYELTKTTRNILGTPKIGMEINLNLKMEIGGPDQEKVEGSNMLFAPPKKELAQLSESQIDIGDDNSDIATDGLYHHYMQTESGNLEINLLSERSEIEVNVPAEINQLEVNKDQIIEFKGTGINYAAAETPLQQAETTFFSCTGEKTPKQPAEIKIDYVVVENLPQQPIEIQTGANHVVSEIELQKTSQDQQDQAEMFPYLNAKEQSCDINESNSLISFDIQSIKSKSVVECEINNPEIAQEKAQVLPQKLDEYQQNSQSGNMKIIENLQQQTESDNQVEMINSCNQMEVEAETEHPTELGQTETNEQESVTDNGFIIIIESIVSETSQQLKAATKSNYNSAIMEIKDEDEESKLDSIHNNLNIEDSDEIHNQQYKYMYDSDQLDSNDDSIDDAAIEQELMDDLVKVEKELELENLRSIHSLYNLDMEESIDENRVVAKETSSSMENELEIQKEVNIEQELKELEDELQYQPEKLITSRNSTSRNDSSESQSEKIVTSRSELPEVVFINNDTSRDELPESESEKQVCHKDPVITMKELDIIAEIYTESEAMFTPRELPDNYIEGKFDMNLEKNQELQQEQNQDIEISQLPSKDAYRDSDHIIENQSMGFCIKMDDISPIHSLTKIEVMNMKFQPAEIPRLSILLKTFSIDLKFEASILQNHRTSYDFSVQNTDDLLKNMDASERYMQAISSSNSPQNEVRRRSLLVTQEELTIPLAIDNVKSLGNLTMNRNLNLWSNSIRNISIFENLQEEDHSDSGRIFLTREEEAMNEIKMGLMNLDKSCHSPTNHLNQMNVFGSQMTSNLFNQRKSGKSDLAAIGEQHNKSYFTSYNQANNQAELCSDLEGNDYCNYDAANQTTTYQNSNMLCESQADQADMSMEKGFLMELTRSSKKVLLYSATNRLDLSLMLKPMYYTTIIQPKNVNKSMYYSSEKNIKKMDKLLVKKSTFANEKEEMVNYDIKVNQNDENETIKSYQSKDKTPIFEEEVIQQAEVEPEEVKEIFEQKEETIPTNNEIEVNTLDIPKDKRLEAVKNDNLDQEFSKNSSRVQFFENSGLLRGIYSDNSEKNIETESQQIPGIFFQNSDLLKTIYTKEDEVESDQNLEKNSQKKLENYFNSEDGSSTPNPNSEDDGTSRNLKDDILEANNNYTTKPEIPLQYNVEKIYQKIELDVNHTEESDNEQYVIKSADEENPKSDGKIEKKTIGPKIESDSKESKSFEELEAEYNKHHKYSSDNSGSSELIKQDPITMKKMPSSKSNNNKTTVRKSRQQITAPIPKTGNSTSQRSSQSEKEDGIKILKSEKIFSNKLIVKKLTPKQLSPKSTEAEPIQQTIQRSDKNISKKPKDEPSVKKIPTPKSKPSKSSLKVASKPTIVTSTPQKQTADTTAINTPLIQTANTTEINTPINQTAGQTPVARSRVATPDLNKDSPVGSWLQKVASPLKHYMGKVTSTPPEPENSFNSEVFMSFERDSTPIQPNMNTPVNNESIMAIIDSENETNLDEAQAEIDYQYKFQKSQIRNSRHSMLGLEGGISGHTYQGSWKNNKYHGIGTLYYNNGKIMYSGHFYNGEHNGMGIQYASNGKKEYEGEFVMGRREGYGVAFDCQTETKRYDGEWINNKRYGTGLLFDYSGQLFYNGQFCKNKRHGQGTQFHTNGNEFYKGNWVDDKKEGHGCTFDVNGKLCFEGIWKNNERLVGKTYNEKEEVISDRGIMVRQYRRNSGGEKLGLVTKVGGHVRHRSVAGQTLPKLNVDITNSIFFEKFKKKNSMKEADINVFKKN